MASQLPYVHLRLPRALCSKRKSAPFRSRFRLGSLNPLSQFPVHIIGAAFTAVAPYVSTWEEGLGNGNDVGGLVGAILGPVGGFGKFLLVLLALSTPSACAPTLYTVCTSFMTISSVFAKIPRAIIAIVSTAM